LDTTGTPLTPKDIRISDTINGPCNTCMVGKFMNLLSRPSTSTPTGRLHADIAFFQEGARAARPYFCVVDDFTGFSHVSPKCAFIGDGDPKFDEEGNSLR
jgi:hypothetical protein